MAEGRKMTGWLIPDLLGAGFILQGFIGPINSVKDALLFIIGLTYAGFRSYYDIRKRQESVRKDVWEREQREGKKTA